MAMGMVNLEDGQRPPTKSKGRLRTLALENCGDRFVADQSSGFESDKVDSLTLCIGENMFV